MASIGSLEVSLAMNASSFNGTVAQVNRNMKAMSSELQALKAKGSDYEKSIGGMSQKQDILARSFDAAGIKLQEQRRRYDELVASGTATEAQIERQANAVNQAQAQYNRLERELAEVTEQLRIQSSQWTQAGQRMQEVGSKLTAVGSSMKQIGQNMSMYVTAPLAAMGAGIVKIGMDFDSQMSKVSAVSGATGADFDALRAKSQELGATTKFTATQVAEGMEYLALAGFKTNQILGATEGMLNLAAAAGMDLGTAADITSDVMSAFGMQAKEAGHAADVFAYAQANANTNVEQMGEAMKYVAPMANQMGWSLEETSAAMMKLADNGLKGSIAGQAFASSLGRLAKPTKAMRKTIDELGLSFFDANDNMKSLPDIVGHLEDKFDGLTMKQKSAAITTLFGAEAYKHWAILIESGSDILNTHTKSLENADGTAKRMADTMNDNLAGSVLMLKSALEGLAIQFSDLIKDDLRTFAEWLTKITGKFAELDEGTKKTILVVGGLVAAIGPVILISGMFISSIGSIISVLGGAAMALGVAGGATTALGATLAVLTGPIGLTVAAIGGLTVGTLAFAKHMSNDALPSVERFGKGVSDSTKEALNGFYDLSENASQSVTNMYVTSTKVTSEMANELTSKFDEMNKQIVEGMKKRNVEQISNLKEFFMNSSALSSEEEEKIISNTQKRHEKEIQEQNIMNERVKAITQKAVDEKRELTEREHEIINNYNRMMKENAVKTFSESELEQKVILERMKENASIITAEQATEVVKNAVKQKEEVLKEANDTYEKRISQIIQMRDETGVISAEQADKMIAEATKAKDQTIYLAEEQHQKIVETAQKQADEHVDKVNWETGEILSKWEVFKNKHSDIFNSVEETYKKVTDSLKEVTSTAYDFIKTTIDEKLSGVVDFIKEQLDKLKEFWDENGEFIVSIVKLHFEQIKSDIEMVMGIIKGIFEIIWPIISGIIQYTWATIKFTIGNTLDLILGIIQTIMKLIQGDWEGAWNSIKLTAEKIMNNIIKYFKDIDLLQVGKDIIQGLIDGIGSMAKAVRDKAKSVAEGIESAIRKKLDTHSPSRVMIAIGKDVGEGLAIGIESTQKRNEIAMKELGQLLIDATKASQDEVTKIADEAEKQRTKIQDDAAKNKLEIEKKLGVDLQKASNTISAKKNGATANDNIKVQQLKETANAKLIKLEQDTQDKLKKINDKAWADMVKKEESMAAERLTLIKRFIDDKKSTEELSLIDEADILEQSLNLFKEGTKERVEVQKAYQKTIEQIKKEEESINKTYNDNVKQLNDEYIKEEERLTKVYQDEFDKRRNAYYSFAGIFDEVVQRDVSGSALITALQSQVTAFEDWQNNIAQLASKGINEGLLAELQAMGPKAGAEIAALNTLTEEQLAEYTELWKTKNEQARIQAEAELTGLKQNTEKQINELQLKTAEQLRIYQNEWRKSMVALKGNVKGEMAGMPNIGVYAVSGLIQGMMSKREDLMNAASALAAIVSGTFESALDIHSPSRVMRGYGVNIGEGLVLGMNDMVSKVAGATKRLANTVANGSYQNVAENTNNSTTNNTENKFNLTVNSPRPLDPYETARLSKNGWKEMALQIG